MKNLFKILSVTIICSVVLLQSCETTELDLRTNPNALSADQASPDFLLNAIQEDFARVVEVFGVRGAALTRIDNLFGRDYRNAYTPGNFNAQWEDIYTEIFTDINAMNDIAETSDLTHHIGIGQFIRAYSLAILVDYFGDVPFSEANLGAENFNPNVDPGASVYDAALGFVDEAIVNFNSTAAANPQNDFFYDNNYTKWVKAANSLKMRLLMQRRLVDASAVSAFNAIVASGDYIADTADDFEWQWGTNEVQPDTRHPRYTQSYTTTGGGGYRSNWMMGYMLENDDPRIRYYYYRQVSGTPGNGATPPDEETLTCSLQTAPAHYAGFTFCSLPEGYWGRDHGDDGGGPPDGFLKTLAGVYPSVGKFDDDTFAGQSQGAGGGGAGITPIILASGMDFLIAEAAMLDGDAPGAKAAILSGLGKSVAKVQTFGAKDPSADLSFEPSAADVAAHSAAIGAKFDAASTSGQWDILGEEFFTALLGNGIDAYNFYRRTGYPTTLQPNLEPNPGGLIRSFFYPSNFVNNNSSVSQKTDVSGQVFWDTNPASPAFPASN